MNPTTTAPGAAPGQDVYAHDATLASDMQTAKRLRMAFYFVVLGVAAYGSVTGAVETLHLPKFIAIGAVGALELGSVVLNNEANARRRLGEQAAAQFLLSAAISIGAVVFNWTTHGNHLLGALFAGLSGLGYLVFVLGTEAARRDRLRAMGKLPPAPPAFGIVHQWALHPRLTWQARLIAKASTTAMTADESFAIARFAAAQLKRLRDNVNKDAAKEAATLANWPLVAATMRAKFDNEALADVNLFRLNTAIRAAMSDLPPARPRPAAKATSDTPANPDTPTGPAPAPAARTHNGRQVRIPVTPVRVRAARLTEATDTDTYVPTIEELADSLAEKRPNSPFTNWRTEALPILRDAWGRCGSDRAHRATALHNQRITARGLVTA